MSQDHPAAVVAIHPPSSGPRLGHARIVEVTPTLRVLREDGATVEATLAVAAPYKPSLDDEVLLIREGARAYVIGVLRARGTARLEAEGDLEIAAGGEIRITSRRSVAVEGPEIHFTGHRLLAVFQSATERFGSLLQSVRDLASLRAGQLETTVEGTSHTRAKSAHLITKEQVHINGKTIHLG